MRAEYLCETIERIKIPKEYGWIWDIVECVVNGKEIPIDEANLVGGRKSAKTTTIILLWVLLCYSVEDKNSFGFIAFRNMISSANDLFDDIIQILEAYEIPYIAKIKRLSITVNGNTLRVVGINNNRKGITAKKAGLPRFGSVKYAFMFFEERFEFNTPDVLSAMEAVRSIHSISGFHTQNIVLNACNPWAKSSEYIKYCARYQNWNVRELRDSGSQIGIYTQDIGEGKYIRKLFHYTNWRVAKDFLSTSEINRILDTWNVDKRRAATTDLGLPGYESGAIYTHILNSIGKAIYQDHERLIAGGDYGWGRQANSGKTAFFFGGASNEEGIDIYGEYIQDNIEVVKEPDKVAMEIIGFYVNQMREYLARNGLSGYRDLKVRVDNAANVFIALLNKIAIEKRLNWLKFVPCAKYPINDRIEITISLAYRHMLRFGDNVKLLKQEMEMSYYEDSETQKRANVNDHAINGFEYAIEPIMYRMAKGYLALKAKKIW